MSEIIQYNKIPITVIQGFLGAGKTTLLNYILTHNEGMNIGVVVNDFGDINIDSELVKSKTDKRLELTSGCICCSLQTLDLQSAIQQFIYPGSSINYIIIEASGLAEPRDLAMTLRYSLSHGVRLDGIITVLDAENLEYNAKAHSTARDQIMFCDFVIISKIDLVTKSKLRDIEKMVRGFNPRVRIIKSERGAVDVRLILDSDLYKLRQKKETRQLKAMHYSHKDHIHEHFTQFSWTSKKSLHPMKFQDFVNHKLPVNIYRAKGVIDFGLKGHNRKYIFQLVGVRPEIVWENWTSEKPQTKLVFIGEDIDESMVETELSACIDPKPNVKLEAGIELRLPRKADW